VVNSNQAVLWACLRRTGGDTRVPSLGRLFAQTEMAAA
jgi:maleate cis-trans isomerase